MNRKIALNECAEIVVVRRFLTNEWGCDPHCAGGLEAYNF